MTLPAMILAGGSATRMGGGDKPLLEWRGRDLIDWVLDDLRGMAGPIAINAQHGPQWDRFGLQVVPDTIADCGPLSGIHTAMQWASQARHVLVVAGDTIRLPRDLTARLGTGPAYAASYQGDEWRAHPTIGIWPTDLAANLAERLIAGDRRVMKWASAVGATEVRFEGDYFRNFNTPEDLAAAD
ncbi:hypothetical protein BVC71_02190 [Marivivens niveibacter]|uniref:Molybdenum cofactor guanylyltransferase n=1 Tax=Marivivens niveibacter TaxID=1930667 RepID=A0A251X0S6_9RHOB|nr:molybdenum cofactor guanylyltransferase [Marivivens niveibacter]OUD10340.1 hypothetical protein BVC71_02190 [Marivivens niveibacter]